MIPRREIDALHAEWGLAHAVIEKDYVLGWLLAGIANHAELRSWVFKGGTCLRKCYFETYRFSEDLDFTVASGGALDIADLVSVFGEVAEWIADRSGLELAVDARSFRERRNKRGNRTFEGRIAFRGPLRQPGTPKVKLDITSDELLAGPAAPRAIVHPYSDADDRDRNGTPMIGTVVCYPLVELMAEKMRALAERCRPRDLYDVVHTHRHPDLLGQARSVAGVLARKCEFAGIPVPTIASMGTSPFRAEIETEWASMLAHQLPQMPPFEQFWVELADVFEWLDARIALPLLPRLEIAGTAVEEWTAPATMTSWRTGAPLELVRFSGANRLLVDLDYVAEEGRSGKRRVEPYALRRSRSGDLLLFVVNDRGQIRSYRVDRIRGAAVTSETFRPSYRVEF